VRAGEPGRVSTGKDMAGCQENVVTPGSKNVIQESLVDRDKLFLPLLLIKSTRCLYGLWTRVLIVLSTYVRNVAL
jgi:hypothetical protein